MFKVIFILGLIVHHGSAMISINKVENTIDRNLKYLESRDGIDDNTTFHLVLASAELLYLQETDNYIPVTLNNTIEKFRQRMQKFISKKLNTSNETMVQYFFYPEIWVNNGDYQFKYGLIDTSNISSNPSPTVIYGKSVVTDDACEEELFKNGQSKEPQKCKVSKKCLNKMTSLSYEDADGVAVDQRLSYLSNMRTMNCSNTPSNMFQLVVDMCDYLYTDVKALHVAGWDNGKAAIYVTKFLLCGTYGIPEFFEDKFLTPILEQVNIDGSVGNLSGDAKNVVTAEVIALFSSVLRLKVAGATSI